MKSIYLHAAILAAALILALSLYARIPHIYHGSSASWQVKKEEIRSRLLSIPIILYHNIDGKGVFSIDSGALRRHFELIRERNIRVISLDELISRIEEPVYYKEKAIVITFDDGFYSMFSRLLPMAREFGFPVTLFVYTDFIYTRAETSLTWKMLRKLDRGGVTIQSHTVSHADLTALMNNRGEETSKRLYEEIYLSKRILELYLEREVEYFAFPYGRYTLDLVELASLAGYRRVFSTDYGSNIVTRDNYCLRRHHIKKDYSLSYFDRLIR